jgi:type 1 glutamine amidotransferase
MVERAALSSRDDGLAIADLLRRIVKCGDGGGAGDFPERIRRLPAVSSRHSMKPLLASAVTVLSLSTMSHAAKDWVEYPAGEGPGKGRHVVLIAGDEEYRSEEGMPMLGKILSQHHGFRCTVLFSVSDGVIDPNAQTSLTNPVALDSADAIVMLTRFRKWPDETMTKFDAAMKRGVPVVGLRTSTHAFQLPKTSAFVSYNSFGKDVLGEKWVSHWGKHKVEAGKGVIETANASHPTLQGVTDVFFDSDVYEAAPPADAKILMRGQVLTGMKPSDPPAQYTKKRADGGEQDINTPMMPIAWTRELKTPDGKPHKIFTTTTGAATDLANEDLRRLIINGVFWALGLDVPAKANADTVGSYQPIMYGFNTFRKGAKPADHNL